MKDIFCLFKTKTCYHKCFRYVFLLCFYYVFFI